MRPLLQLVFSYLLGKERCGKITDVELLVLPKFRYELTKREDFEQSSKDVIRRHLLDFLIWNMMVSMMSQTGGWGEESLEMRRVVVTLDHPRSSLQRSEIRGLTSRLNRKGWPEPCT